MSAINFGFVVCFLPFVGQGNYVGKQRLRARLLAEVRDKSLAFVCSPDPYFRVRNSLSQETSFEGI